MRIEINLLGEKKKRKGGGLELPNIAELIKQVKDPLLLGAIASWVVALIVIGFLFMTQRSTVSGLESDVERVRQEERRYKNLIRQKVIAGALRDSLVAELQAIREIDADRFVWPHVLDEITKALPDYTWLTGISALTPSIPVGTEGDTTAEPPLQINIEGQTSDISAMTRFVRNLQLSPWIASVTIGPNTQVPVEGQVVTAFSVTAQFQTADSAYIRTVPVAESVR